MYRTYWLTSNKTDALCKAAYDGSDLSVLAEAIPSSQKIDDAEIESIKDFFRRFGCEYILGIPSAHALVKKKLIMKSMWHSANLCDYITKDNGDSDSGRINKQDYAVMNVYSWPQMEQSTEIQGFFSTARKIGSK